MRQQVITLIFLLTSSFPCSYCQQPVASKVTLTPSGAATLISVTDPRPLFQVVDAMRMYFGWTVDYVDPLYTSHDLLDDTDPLWRSTHPGSPGVTRVAGKDFHASILTPTVEDDDEKLKTLQALVSQYTQTSNPGKFTVLKEGSGRFLIRPVAVPGIATPPFDTMLTTPSYKGNAYGALEMVLSALSQKTGVRAGLGLVPTNLFIQTPVSLQQKETTASEAILAILGSARFEVEWEALYDADMNTYFVGMKVSKRGLIGLTPATQGSTQLPQ